MAMLSRDNRQIKTIKFGVFSAEEIRKLSVCEVNNPAKTGYGTVYDPRMGSTDSISLCETCKDSENCVGHFGNITLTVPIVHSLYYKRVSQYLTCICLHCYRLVLLEDQMKLCGLLKYKGETRFQQILDRLPKVDICYQPDCGKDRPKIRLSVAENKFYKVYEEKKKKTSIQITTEEIFKIFDNVPDEDVVLMGFDPRMIHPRNLVLTEIPVLPPTDRPYVKADGKIFDDDLTNQYIEIVKINNALKKLEANNDPKKYETLLNRLQFNIQTTWNNGKKKAKHAISNRPIKCISGRLKGKQGQIRSNIQAKRTDRTARSVIGPDPTARVNEVVVPPQIANILTIPFKVTKYNIEELQELVDKGEVPCINRPITKPDGTTITATINVKKFRRGTRLIHGDIIYRGEERIRVDTGRDQQVQEGDAVKRGKEFLKKLIPANRPYKLEEGWTVHRLLYDGVYVALGRQPVKKI